MTKPFDSEISSPETDQATSLSNQGGRARDEDSHSAAEEKPLSFSRTTPSDEWIQQIEEKYRREEIYRQRLEEWWAAAQSSSSSVGNSDERDIFLRTMLRVSEDLAVLIDDEEAASLPTEAIKGSIQEVELEIVDRLSAELGQDELGQFLRTSVAATIGRLERVREGNPEKRVDIIMRVLFILRGSTAAAKLACELYRYLESQSGRDIGYYQTMTNLAIVVSAARPEYVTEGIFIYHSVLDGVRVLGETQKLTQGNYRQIVNTAAANLATAIASRVRDSDSGIDAKTAEILGDLKTISAVTFSIASFVAEPQPIVAALRFSTMRPAEFLSSIMDMASVSEGWGLDNVTTSRLEASAGVAAAAAGNISRAVDLFFNSGISLRRHKGFGDERSSPLLIKARMLVNSLGLRLSLGAGDALDKSLLEFDGIDCAVNFLGSYVDYRATGNGQVDLETEVLPLAVEVAHLAKWPLLRRVDRRLDIGRLEVAARQLGITVEERSTFPGMGPFYDLSDRAVGGLRSVLGLASTAQADLLVDTAELIGSLYDSVLAAEDAEKLPPQVDELVAGNDDPLSVLSRRYRRYGSQAPGDPGLGPAVEAAAITEAEWRNVATRLTDPVLSVVRAIANFGN